MPKISNQFKHSLLTSHKDWDAYFEFKTFLLTNSSTILNFEKFIFPEHLALLFMDQGSLESRGHALVFCSEKWNYEALLSFKNILLNKYKITATFQKRNVKGVFIGNRLSLKSTNLEIFINTIYSYVLPEFYYKLELYKSTTKRLKPIEKSLEFSQQQKDLLLALIICRGNAKSPLEFKGEN